MIHNIAWIYKELLEMVKSGFELLRSSLTIYFSILPLYGLQLPLREKHLFSFCHWENERSF